MSEQAQHAEHGHADHGHHETNYVKIWAILLVLLIVSVLGPMLGIKVVTLITAFGIAVVKAYLVVTRFMHINVEKRYITYLMVTCLAFMGLLFAGVAPDVLKHDGKRWTNAAAKESAKHFVTTSLPAGHH
ncbi:MAG: cytochrome C oxidase subunit IV family protein [Deltaproteobacteria bacterium]|nr:cytochrome C oxidase subunit IV family protein [Deltaproteobacteria bacterium]